MGYKLLDVILELELSRSEGIAEGGDEEAALRLGTRDGICLDSDDENEYTDGDNANSSTFVLCQLRVTLPDRPRGGTEFNSKYSSCV